MSCRVLIPPLFHHYIPTASTACQHAGLPGLHNTTTTTAAAGTSFPPRSACSAYESFNAAVGLLGIYNDAILSEQPGQQQQDAANWAFWLAAVEQVRGRVQSLCPAQQNSAQLRPFCSATEVALLSSLRSRRATGSARVRQRTTAACDTLR